MKKLLFLLLLISTATFAQIKINPVPVGYPVKQATDLLVRVLPFDTNAKTCQLYWEMKNVTVQDEQTTESVLAVGNLGLSEQEFCDWGHDNKYIEDLVLQKLNLTRKTE